MKKILISMVILLTGIAAFGGSSAPPVEDHLDYGLYWLGYDDAKEKFVEGELNQYYDPSKPVVIYIHGWQPGTSEDNYGKETLYFDRAKVWAHNNWIDKGWNVAVFYWSQWADEDSVWDAEAKIWSRYGKQGFRYRLKDGSYSTALNPSTGACGDLAYKAYVKALAGNTSGNIRLVGHSLGNQMVTRVAELVYENITAGNISENTYKINRIALLDPAWTGGGKDYLGDSNGDGKKDWVGERCRWALFKMMNRWNDFVVEIYNTTALDQSLGVTDENTPLRERSVGTVSVKPWYYSATQISEKHKVIPRHYFWSMAYSAPVECTISWSTRYSTGNMGPSASTPNWRMLQMMGNIYRWEQVEGRYTENPNDDWFERKSF
jgi:hypothetical protein